ncbi:MAG: DNA topoisomerase [Lachnospiraceae bacterium]
MGKPLFIAEKPSVAAEFAKALKLNTRKKDGYVESDAGVVTWCVGHLVTMSYPEAYDERMKRWSLDTLPFIPEKFLYEVIPAVSRQFNIVKALLNREDIECIYVCTDSGREGEYIYRLVEQMSGVKGKIRKRVWIDSQTEEEILRGVREAKDLSEYDNLSEAAYLRAKEDYLMGINFSRVLTLKYGNSISNYLKKDRVVISVGRVMTCVLGMIVRREREIREFVKTPFYRVLGSFDIDGLTFDGEWRVKEESRYYNTPVLYKDNGFKEKKTAKELIDSVIKAVEANIDVESGKKYMVVDSIEKKKESKNPPLLFNLAELQNECSKMFKISPDETLKIAQELYEKKMVTYPRTDARVMSSAVAKEIYKNIAGLKNYEPFKSFAGEILEKGSYKKISGTKYVNDSQITDHYAIIPTGQGFNALNSLSGRAKEVYEVIGRRFLSIFYPAAVYQKVAIALGTDILSRDKKYHESFFASFKVLLSEGYLKVANSYIKGDKEKKEEDADIKIDVNTIETLKNVKKGAKITFNNCFIKEGETSPPKRYNSGSLILAMENAGQLIEDEELRAQIKGSGIGTSATRAEILKKLINNQYLALNKKTQIITPTQIGEMIYDVVDMSIKPLLNPELTASWEKGLTLVAEGKITGEEYMVKLDGFVTRRVNAVRNLNNQTQLRGCFDKTAANYKKV